MYITQVTRRSLSAPLINSLVHSKLVEFHSANIRSVIGSYSINHGPNVKWYGSNNNAKAFIDRVTVIGGGHMGTGIAQVSAAAGNNVIVTDICEGMLEKSKGKITQRLLRAFKKLHKNDVSAAQREVDKVLKRLQFSTNLESCLEMSDLVVEAVPEKVELKQELFFRVDQLCPEHTILVTNTSSIPIQEIGTRLSDKRKGQFGGVHFFDAVAIKLVEVIRTGETKDEVFHKIKEWSQFIGKVPVSCKDTPGFIVNRLTVPFFLQAVAMVERGDASMKDIDTAMKLGAGYPYGPFELADYIGIDVIYMILKGWEKRFKEPNKFICPKTIEKLYKEGNFGVKTGQGFFSHKK